MAGINDRMTLTSPAIAKVKSMERDLKPLCTSYGTEFTMEFARAQSDGTISAEVLADLPNPHCSQSGKIQSGKVQSAFWNWHQIQIWLKELAKDDCYFNIGSLFRRCTPNSTAALCSSSSTVAFDSGTYSQELCHHLDWALFEVNDRRGINQHRYKYDNERAVLDYSFTVANQQNLGSMIHETGTVKANANAFFEGQGNGRVNGVINATLMGVSRAGRKTFEHHLIVDQKQDWKALGDSGAAVVGESDHKLLGLIWGSDSCGKQPIFTPIGTIFQDVKDHLKATTVELPSIQDNEPPEPLVPITTIEVDLSSGNEVQRPKKPPLRPTNVKLPEPDELTVAEDCALLRQILNNATSSLTGEDILKIASSAISVQDLDSASPVPSIRDRLFSSSPAPSLSFSRSSTPESESPFLSESPNKMLCAENAVETTLIIDEDSEDTLNMIRCSKLDKADNIFEMRQPVRRGKKLV